MSKKGFTYTLQIDAEINDLIAKTNMVKKSMESIMSAGKAPEAEKIFGSIERAIERLQQRAAQPIESVAAFSAIEKDAAAVGVQLKKLGSVVESLGNMSVADKMDLLPPDLKKQIEDVSAALVTFSKAQAQAAQKSQALIDAENGLAAAQKELKKAEGRVQDKQALIQAQQALVDSAHEEADAIKAKIDALKKYQATAAAYEAAGGDKRKAGGGKEELAGLNLPADRIAAKKVAPGLDLGNAQAVADEITRLGDAYSQASKAVTDAESTQRRYNKQLNEANNAAAVASSRVTALQQSVTQLNQEFERDKAKNVQAAYAKLRTEAGKLGVDLSSIPIDYTEQNLLELNDAMNKLVADGIAQVDQDTKNVRRTFEELNETTEKTTEALAQNKNTVVELDEKTRNATAFTERIKQFVGLQGASILARKALNDAMNAVKDLDAVMTEMAMVTDAGIGDYWNQLPEHTKRANVLGIAINDVYKAETLYYQQGLKVNEVTAMSTETLKMMKIAGLSAEDATNKMTAALRGFNMELNETSAQRVSDVYSELAAITAADVEEISSAMSKTASIASSAGMEFETTAAFLSQIIETTRESAETAGTALKTVIARFQELKKDPAEIGEIDGEIVDANKIETALRSVGVALRDSSGQFRDLDSVFLELSSKWNTLDVNTQRYIATIAAGSRQQSRFIAMMQDYGRTQELVNAANNSAGASQQQYEKTLESLESKLNQLSNAWDTFTTGLLNQDVIKFGVDVLTKLLEFVNKLTDGFGGLTGTISKLGLIMAVFKLGQKMVSKFSQTFINTFKKAGVEAGKGLVEGWRDGLDTIKKESKNAGKQISDEAYYARSDESKIGADGHMKGFREQIMAPVMAKTATQQVQATTASAVGGAAAGTSLKSAVEGATIQSGAMTGMKGQALGAQSFTQTFDANTIKAIESQFIQSMTSMGVKIDEATASWKEFELEMGTVDALTGIEQLDAKLAKVAKTATDAKTKVTQLTVDGAGMKGTETVGEAASKGGKKQSLKDRIGSALTESTGISTAREASRAKAANKAMAARRGKSMLGTMQTLQVAPKLDGKALAAVEKQFKDKMKAMGKTVEEVDAEWSALESNFGDGDAINALTNIDNKLKEVADETGNTDAEMQQISNTAETTGAMGEKSFEGTKTSLENVSNACTAVGGAMMGVGVAFNAVGGMFRSLGLDAVADAFDTVGQVIMFVGSALMLIPPIISIINLALSTPPIGIIMLIIGAIVIGLTLIISLIASIAKSNSTAEKLKAAGEAANEAKENAKAAKEAFDSLLEDKNEYDELSQTIKELTEGTTDWKNATAELSKKILELVELYPQLAQYMNWDKGYLDLSSEGWDYILEQQAQVVSNAQTIAAQRQMEVEQFNVNSAVEEYSKAYNKFAKATNGMSGNYRVLYNQMQNAVEKGLDSQEYLTAVADMEKYIASAGGQGQVEFQAYKNALETKKRAEQARDAQKLQAFRAQGSIEAQQSENYNAIINSLKGTYNTELNNAKADARQTLGGQGKGDEHFYDNGSNDTNGRLKQLLAEEGLMASGDEVKDMAALLKAKTGEEYTQEMRDEAGKGADEELADKLEEAYTAEGLGDVVDELYKLQQENSEIAEMYSGNLDVGLLTEDQIDGMSDLSSSAKQALKNQVKVIEQGRKDVDLQLQKIYNNDNLEAMAFAGGYEQAKKFLDTYNNMLSGAGGELAKSFRNMFAGLEQEQQEDFFANYGDVNWNSSIEGAAALKEALEDDNVAIRVFAQSSLEMEKDFYSATSQANELYRSLEADTLKELASDGKIAATEILELSKSNDKLATMLENTGVSASTLGRYYEMLEEGTLNAASATDDFVRVLETLNGAANTIEDSFAFIDTWEPTRSSTEISATFEEMRDEMFELYNSGALGDEALEDYIEAFIGADKWEALVKEKGGNVKVAMEQVMNQVRTFEGNFKSLWQEIANSGKLEGVSMGEEGSVLFDFEKLGSTEQLKEQIQGLGWSEEMADALIADAQTFGVGLKDGLKEINIQEAFVEWLTTSVKFVGSQKIIDEDQFKAFIEESGLDPKIAKAAIEKQGIEIQSALDEAGNLNAWIRESILGEARATGTFDIQETYQLMLDLGLNDTAAKKQMAALAEELEDVPFTLNGSTVKEAGAELSSITYQGQNYGSTMALIDAVQNEKVIAEQKKASLDQATTMGKAMAVASVSASNAGTKSMAVGLENVINGVVDAINAVFGWTGLKMERYTGLSNAVDINTQNEINYAISSIDRYYKSDYEEIEKVLNSTTEGIDTKTAQDIYKNIKENSTIFAPTEGEAYGNVNEVLTDTQKKEKENDYETPYDWLFALNQTLEDTIREREKLEQKYEKLLEAENFDLKTFVETRNSIMKQLEAERQQQQDIITATKVNQQATMDEIKSKIPELANYLSYNAETGQVSVSKDYEIANIDPATRELYDEYIAALLENEKTINDAQDSIDDTNDKLDEMNKEGRDETSDLYNRVKDALMSKRQAEIDELSAINESIQSAQDSLVSKMQEQINESRQARDNEKQENDIADKETRLAYLMRDTSGGNATEIAALQKEIGEAKESYADSLIDQSLQKLQDANAKAAEQREEQINLMQLQLDSYVNSEDIWKDVKTIMDNSLTAIGQGTSPLNTDLGKLLKWSEVDGGKLNPYEEEDWYKELKTSTGLSALFSGAIIDAFTSDDLKTPTTDNNSYGEGANRPAISWKAYASGGLADFTGPAWLDGTKTHPEMVLNQTDTANFIILKDILSEILNGTSGLSKTDEKRGDNYFDIEINVDSINDDYDVEQMAEKIKDMLYEDSMYRNVNTINMIR